MIPYSQATVGGKTSAKAILKKDIKRWEAKAGTEFEVFVDKMKIIDGIQIYPAKYGSGTFFFSAKSEGEVLDMFEFPVVAE